jgi:hypothetical protein
MDEKLPVRAESHELEELSKRFFEQCLPPAWTTTKPKDDYGIDYYVGIAVDGKMTGKEIIVQLKASKHSEGNTDHETITLRTSTYNYLMKHSLVVILVKFVEEDKEAYWIYLRDTKPPANPEQETIAINVPKSNPLTKLDWIKDVVPRVATIQERKIMAAKGM